MSCNDTTTHNNNNNGLSGGQVALIIIGCVLVIGLIAALIAWLMTDKKKNKSKSKANIVQIGGAVNNEQQQGQAVNQSAAPAPNNTTETNNQSPANNEVINQQDQEQLLTDVVSAAIPRVMAATEQFIEQKASEAQKPETTKEETKQEEKQEEENKNDFVQPLMAKAETKSNVDEDDISNENDQKQDKQKAENFDEIDKQNDLDGPFTGLPLGMMIGGNKGDNQQPNKQPIPMFFPITQQPNQNVNISAKQQNLMPQANKANNSTNQPQQQYVNEPKNEQQNAEQPEFPANFGGSFNNPLKQLSMAKEQNDINNIQPLNRQEEEKVENQPLQNSNTLPPMANMFGAPNLNENRFNIEEPKENAALAELPTPPQNDISNLSVAQQTNQQTNDNKSKHEEIMDDGVIMPLNMMPAQNQDLEQKPMDNNVLDAPPKFIKNEDGFEFFEYNGKPCMRVGGTDTSPTLVFDQDHFNKRNEHYANVFDKFITPAIEKQKLDLQKIDFKTMFKEMQQNNGQSMLPTMAPEQQGQNNVGANNNFEHDIKDQKMDETQPMMQPMPLQNMFTAPMKTHQEEQMNQNNSKDQQIDTTQPMMQPMPLAQMFAEPMKTNQGAQLDKNNSNQNENKGAPMGNPMLNFLMPKQNNNQNEIPNAFNQTNPNILEEQQVQANNGQSQINLGTQNKCTCSLCSGGGGN